MRARTIALGLGGLVLALCSLNAGWGVSGIERALGAYGVVLGALVMGIAVHQWPSK